MSAELPDATREASRAAATCAWCGGPMPPRRRRDAVTCSKPCRQARQRFHVAPAGTTADRARRFAYADPPYPGLARKYYRCDEVDHADLVAGLMGGFPDGWALSTSAAALRGVLVLCPPGVRVCSWVRRARRGRAWRPRNAWEPLIVYGGRPRLLGVAEDLSDVLLGGGYQRSHPGALVGMKPAAFAEWMFRQLGAGLGDELVDLFPGSGAIGRAWSLYVSPPTSGARRVPSRLAGAARRLAEVS